MVAKEGARRWGPKTSNGVTESMGLMADCTPDPLIDPEACRFGPKLLGPGLCSQWRPRRGVRDGCRRFKAVGLCSRSCGSSIEASGRHDGTRQRHRGGLAVCLENEPPVSGTGRSFRFSSLALGRSPVGEDFYASRVNRLRRPELNYLRALLQPDLQLQTPVPIKLSKVSHILLRASSAHPWPWHLSTV